MRVSYRERLVIQAPKVSDYVFTEEKHPGCSLSIHWTHLRKIWVKLRHAQRMPSISRLRVDNQCPESILGPLWSRALSWDQSC